MKSIVPLLKYLGSDFLATDKVALKPINADNPATEARNAPAKK